jgi:hypothetical protein
MSTRAVTIRSILAAAIAGFGATAALAADRASAVIECKATPEALVYDCLIRVNNARTSAPLDGATVTVGADMPSMPMSHNVRPVIAKATGRPGEYQARLALEMHGDWALRLTVTGPLRDQLVAVKRFDAAGTGPPHRKGGHSHRGNAH